MSRLEHPSIRERTLTPEPFHSLTTSHPFLSARESMLVLFDNQLQSKRQRPDASLEELFVALHGMIFTHIQLDDFEPVFKRFMRALSLVEAETGRKERRGRGRRRPRGR